jgi:hypothetical protein
MNHQRKGVAVLARFPDLSNVETPAKADEPKSCGLLASGGRLISQALSIKLLAGITLFLLVGAVLPVYLSTKDAPAGNPPPAADTLSAWPAKQIAPSPETAPAQTDTVAMSVARQPAVRVAPAAEQQSAPVAIPVAAEAKRDTPPVQSVAGAMMSNWEPPVDPNQPPANPGVAPADRPTEYRADNRGNQQLR